MVSLLILVSLFPPPKAKAGMYLDVYAEIGVWAIVTFVAGLLCLLLPRTPHSLPDTLTHIYMAKELQ